MKTFMALYYRCLFCDRRGFFALLFSRLGVLTLATLISLGTARAQEPEIRLHFINVGQANSTLIETPCGAVLIDAGAQDDEHADKLVEYLGKFFDRRTDLNRTLELVGITHNHIDHTMALRKVIENFTVKRYIDNGQLDGPGTGNPKWLRKEIQEGRRAITLEEIEDDAVKRDASHRGLTDATIDPLHCSNCDPSIRVLSGRRGEDSTLSPGEFDNKNNHSIVWRIDFGKIALLMTGDLEEPAIEDLLETYKNSDVLDADIYEVGHHGSHNGTTEELLHAITPTRAVISMGLASFGRTGRNRFTTFAYGHPRRNVVEMLADNVTKTRSAKTVKVADRARHFTNYTVHKAIYGTGWDGTIVMTGKLDGTLRATLDN